MVYLGATEGNRDKFQEGKGCEHGRHAVLRGPWEAGLNFSVSEKAGTEKPM